jgi:Suppressor of fused protein (SUFU)
MSTHNSGDVDLIASISAHVESCTGPIALVWHEQDSDGLHIDVHHVPAAPEREFELLVTSGMSEFPMNAPEQMASFRYAELCVLLPQGWPITESSLQTAEYGWPFWLLKRSARYPIENRTWIGYGHTMGNGGESFAPDTSLDSVILLPPFSLPEHFSRFEGPGGRRIHFWALVPLYSDERVLAREQGSAALLQRFDRSGISDIIAPQRINVAAGSADE